MVQEQKPTPLSLIPLHAITTKQALFIRREDLTSYFPAFLFTKYGYEHI